MTKIGKLFYLVAFLVAIICTVDFYHPDSLAPIALNRYFTQGIPHVVGALMLAIVFVIFHSFKVKHRSDILDFEVLSLQKKLQKKQKVLFSAQFRAKEEQTEWCLFNKSAFTWSNAWLFIEKFSDGKKEIEKFNLSHLESNTHTVLHSKLSPCITARWRVLIVTEKGYALQFPKDWPCPSLWKEEKQSA